MGDPYLGEIRMFGGSYAPMGWAFCAGQQMPISENDALFNLIGTTYGGDGQTYFNLPDLQGRTPIHQGNAHVIGEEAGDETVTLKTVQLPVHTHPMQASSNQGTLPDPGNNILARSSTAGVFLYETDFPDVQLAPQSIGPAGGQQPHDNMAPFLCISFIIALNGIYPSPN